MWGLGTRLVYLHVLSVCHYYSQCKSKATFISLLSVAVVLAICCIIYVVCTHSLTLSTSPPPLFFPLLPSQSEQPGVYQEKE